MSTPRGTNLGMFLRLPHLGLLEQAAWGYHWLRKMTRRDLKARLLTHRLQAIPQVPGQTYAHSLPARLRTQLATGHVPTQHGRNILVLTSASHSS